MVAESVAWATMVTGEVRVALFAGEQIVIVRFTPLPAQPPPVPVEDDTVMFSVLRNFPALSSTCTVMRWVPTASGRDVFTVLLAI